MERIYKTNKSIATTIRVVLLLSVIILMTMVQALAAVTITTNPADPINITYIAGSKIITITSSTASNWSATQLSGADWASPASANGSNGSTLTVTYQANSTSENRTTLYMLTTPDGGVKYLSIIQAKEGISPVIQQISSLKPNGSYKSGEIIYVDVVYSDDNEISLSGTNPATDFYLNYNNGAKAYYFSEDAYSAGTKKITFKYTVGSSTTEDVDMLNVSSVSISGDVAVKDAANNNANQTLPGANNLAINNTLRIDNTVPNISSVTSNATSGGILKIGDQIVFTANFTSTHKEPGATVTSDTYNGDPLIWTTSDVGVTYTATYTVGEGDPNQTSAIQVTGVHAVDAAATSGNTVAGTDVAKTIDADKPTGQLVPDDGATNVDVTLPITLEFQEAVFDLDNTTLTPADFLTKITLERTTSPIGAVAFTAAIDGTNKIITITPTGNLLGASGYTVAIAAGLVRDAGNNLNYPATSSFTTETTTITNTTKIRSYHTVGAAFSDASDGDNIKVEAGVYAETATLGTASITLQTDGAVSVQDIIISGDQVLTLDGDLTLTGELNLSGVDDKFAVGANTLFLNGSITGSGYVVGTSLSDLTVAGSGTFGALNMEGELNNFTINRALQTISLGNLASALPVNTLNLQAGALELAFNSIVVSNYSRTNGTIIGDDLASIEMTGAASGALVFSGDVYYFGFLFEVK